ncbi:MAG: SDR family oxidoreductase [Chloroflexi bacterium]|nr:SDR family oxidoreductase [Chloroflexota bacterium]
MNDFGKRILVTGGCGYIGSVLVPKLAQKYQVTVLDSMLFGNHLPIMQNVDVVKGDIRDLQLLLSMLPGNDVVIHLAAIANDPCSDLDPSLTYEVNRDAVIQLVNAAKNCGVKRFINASTSSVYGVKEEAAVTEELVLEPITLYAKLKAETERVVANAARDGLTTVSIRSATVCGVSPRMRFDVIVNILAKLAITNGVITVHGGAQYRPNIHIDDITDLYVMLVEAPAEKINGKVFNVGTTNYAVEEIANMVREETGAVIEINADIADNRSYRISSEKIKDELGFQTKKTVREAIQDIKGAFDRDMFPNADNSIHYNIRTMKELFADRIG